MLVAGCGAGGGEAIPHDDIDMGFGMTHTRYTGTRTETISLAAGSHIMFENVIVDRGQLNIRVTDPQDNTIYTGTIRRTQPQFSVVAHAHGYHTITIESIAHSGSYSITWLEALAVTRRITITTNVGGADVFFGGEHKGVTSEDAPHSITFDSTAGEHEVQIAKSGYETTTFFALVREDLNRQEFSIALQE